MIISSPARQFILYVWPFLILLSVFGAYKDWFGNGAERTYEKSRNHPFLYYGVFTGCGKKTCILLTKIGSLIDLVFLVVVYILIFLYGT
jgi:hypothetical protein